MNNVHARRSRMPPPDFCKTSREVGAHVTWMTWDCRCSSEVKALKTSPPDCAFRPSAAPTHRHITSLLCPMMKWPPQLQECVVYVIPCVPSHRIIIYNAVCLSCQRQGGICRQTARKGCQKSYHLMALPDPCKTHFNIGTVLKIYTAPRQPGLTPH